VSALTAVLGAVATGAAASADILNELDGVAGDGDMGVTVTTASRLLGEVLPTLESAPPAEVLRTCGLTLARGAPSTIGTLVATGFLRASRVAETLPVGGSPTAALAGLLAAAADGIRERGGAERGSKTVLDALMPAVEAAQEATASEISLRSALRRIAEAADAGAKATATMQAIHGRAGWLAERSSGHEDAGARFAAIALRAALDAVAGDGE
jgi:dihydroxyacetone kinase-like protein